MTGLNYYKDKVCLNVLGGSIENAKEIYKAAEKNVTVGVLSVNYPDVSSAVKDMKKYNEVLEGNVSIGLGGGNPNQWLAVAGIAEQIVANHVNQAFPAVGYTRAKCNQNISHINAMVAPSGKPGYVNISTGPKSREGELAIVPVESAINLIKDMGGNSIKFFPMHGLECREELIEVAKACAKEDFILEPTGGISLDNYEEILRLILDAGVKKVIPHVYSSIIDKETGNTRIEDVKTLYEITKKVVG